MKKRIKKHLTDLLKDESGQGTTEYILILVVVIAIAGFFRKPISNAITTQTTKISAAIDKFVDI